MYALKASLWVGSATKMQLGWIRVGDRAMEDPGLDFRVAAKSIKNYGRFP
jgi:hypothetical protein